MSSHPQTHAPGGRRWGLHLADRDTEAQRGLVTRAAHTAGGSPRPCAAGPQHLQAWEGHRPSPGRRAQQASGQRVGTGSSFCEDGAAPSPAALARRSCLSLQAPSPGLRRTVRSAAVTVMTMTTSLVDATTRGLTRAPRPPPPRVDMPHPSAGRPPRAWTPARLPTVAVTLDCKAVA